MRNIFPWFLAIALGTVAAVLFVSGRTKGDEIQRLRAESEQAVELRAELDAARDELESQRSELEKLRSDNSDLLRLRGESRQLRDQLQLAQRDVDTARQAMESARIQMQNQSQQQRQIFQTSACIQTLRTLDGAKQQWALDKQRTGEAIPMPHEIAPYFPNSTLPNCPSGGQYQLNAVAVLPTCSIPGHALPAQQPQPHQ